MEAISGPFAREQVSSRRKACTSHRMQPEMGVGDVKFQPELSQALISSSSEGGTVCQVQGLPRANSDGHLLIPSRVPGAHRHQPEKGKKGKASWSIRLEAIPNICLLFIC